MFARQCKEGGEKEGRKKPITPCNLREITHQSSKSFVILRLFLVHLFLWPPLLESCQHFLFKLTAIWGISVWNGGQGVGGGCSRFLLISSPGFFNRGSFRVLRSCWQEKLKCVLKREARSVLWRWCAAAKRAIWYLTVLKVMRGKFFLFFFWPSKPSGFENIQLQQPNWSTQPSQKLRVLCRLITNVCIFQNHSYGEVGVKFWNSVPNIKV